LAAHASRYAQKYMYVAIKTMEAWTAWFGFATREWIVVGKGANEDPTGHR
jgi:hypothetical protein